LVQEEKNYNSRQGKGMIVSNLTMDQHGTREATSMETHGGLKAMHRDIRLVQQRHGSQEKTIIKIEEKPLLESIPHFTRMDGWLCMVLVSYVA